MSTCKEHTILKTKNASAQLLPSAKKEFLAMKGQKQIERSLLPDAPPRKRSRKQSPDRVACRFCIGTPIIPPPPKLQAWEIRKMEKREKLHSQKPSPSPIPTPPIKNISAETPTSTISFAEALGLSPLHVDQTSGNLKPAPVKMAAPKAKKIPVSKSKARVNVDCGVGSSSSPTPPTSLCTSTSSQSQSKTVCKSDLDNTSKVDAVLDEWLREEDNDTLHEANDFECNEAINFADLEPAHITDDLNPESVEWLAHEDAEADRMIQHMTTPEHLTFDWSYDHSTFVGQRENFRGTPGPTFPVDDTTRPLDVFLKFFNNDFLDLLVRETNKHSTYIKTGKHITKNSRLNFWVDTDRSEMAVFFAVLIFQGLAPLTSEKDYWRENGYLTLKYFKELMTYNRYLLLKRMLHFVDGNTTGQEMTADKGRLKKIWPVLEHLNKQFSSLYLPGRDVAIDESLLKWHGRLSFAQKIATKAAKVGIKSYELCESSTGYLWKFFVYTGKRQTDNKETDGEMTDDNRQMDNGQTENRLTDDRQTNDIQTDEETSSSTSGPLPSNATARIVYDLTRPLLNRGHTIIMDNFYNSPLLARYLKSHGTDCYGTLRVNREYVPEAIKSAVKNELRVGEMVQSYCRDLSVTLWRDNNVVAMLSTFHKGEVAGKEKHGRYKYKPQVVLDYNLSMGGVDKKDQLLSSHPIERSRNLAWYKKVFRRLLNVTVLNSYIIFKTFNKTITHRAFRQRLAEELIQTFKRPRVEFPTQVVTKSLVSGPGTIRRPIISGNHFIGAGKTKSSRCVWCRNSRSRYICKQCEVTLCLEICFEEFHTLRESPKPKQKN